MSDNYRQGHSTKTLATQQQRSGVTDAGFLLQYIEKQHRILDVGCGPGTITADLAKQASEGSTVGLDVAADVLEKAKLHATASGLPIDGPGSLSFVEGNVTDLPFSDNTFDVVFASQVFGHFAGTELPLRALSEIHRVLRPGGFLGTRDALAQHFYPASFELDRLWVGNFGKVINHGLPLTDPTPPAMPRLMRMSGFTKIIPGAEHRLLHGKENRQFFVWRSKGQLSPGDAFYESWLKAGITQEEIEEVLLAIESWADDQDAFYVAIQGQMMAWK